MPVPDYQSLMLPLLQRAAQASQPISIIEVQPLVADDLKLTEADLAERLPSGRQGVFHNRLHWAKQYMTRAGVLASTQRGRFVVTDRGRALLAEGLGSISNRALARYPDFRDWIGSRGSQPVEPVNQASPASPDATMTPEERIDEAWSELTANLRAELLARVRSMPPSQFEGLIIDLLVQMGYGQGSEELARVLGGSGDGGVDGVVHQDPLGLDRVYIQAKRYQEGSNVGPDAINSFIGALNIKRANKGLFVTASAFTKQASAHALSATTHVVLVDGEQLANLMVRHGVGVVIRQTVEIKAIDEGFFGG